MDKTWFRNIFIDLLEYEFGVHEKSTDHNTQTKTWGCHGCAATWYTQWPTWGRPKFRHEPGCKYVQFMVWLDGNGPQEDTI